MRLTVFGANGPTGRLLVDQALAAGDRVTAVTRHPDSIPPRDRLSVVGADVADAHAVDAAIAGSDAVLSALGVSYSRKPITVYSQGATNIIAAMHRHGVKRLVVVSSAPLDPAYRPSDSLFFTRVLEPLFMRRPGRTTYDDLRRMESLVRASDLDWTIIRSCWLFDAAAVTDYRLAENSAGGMFTARADLAASMLAQLADDRFIRRVVGVTTTAGTPSIIRQVWREGVTKPKKR
jgi:putative NADH-flavin reductase